MKRLSIILAAAAVVASLAPAAAQQWPTRPIVWVVPFAAGGGTDAFARPLAAQLDQQLPQRTVIENRAGAGGTVGASAASKAAPDGYTFFVGAVHHTIAESLYPKLDYDIQKDFVPVAVIATPPQIITVHPERIKANNLAELIAYAKANPGKINYGSAGAGTLHHLAGELFQNLTQTKLNHVPYRGAGPAMADLVAGHVDMMFDGLGTSATQINGGALRGLALAAPERSPTLPNVPTAKEAGLNGYEFANWYAIWAPKGTPQPIIDRMIAEIKKAFEQPQIKEAWLKNGSVIPNMTGPQMATFVAGEVTRWTKVVKDAGVKLE